MSLASVERDALNRLGFTGEPDESLVRSRDLEWHAFPQWWGSTALGFGGMGGASMTMATTVVALCKWTPADGAEGAKALVYFGGRFAYECLFPRSAAFAEALERRRMPSRRDAEKAFGATWAEEAAS